MYHRLASPPPPRLQRLQRPHTFPTRTTSSTYHTLPDSLRDIVRVSPPPGDRVVPSRAPKRPEQRTIQHLHQSALRTRHMEVGENMKSTAGGGGEKEEKQQALFSTVF